MEVVVALEAVALIGLAILVIMNGRKQAETERRHFGYLREIQELLNLQREINDANSETFGATSEALQAVNAELEGIQRRRRRGWFDS